MVIQHLTIPCLFRSAILFSRLQDREIDPRMLYRRIMCNLRKHLSTDHQVVRASLRDMLGEIVIEDRGSIRRTDHSDTGWRSLSGNCTANPYRR